MNLFRTTSFDAQKCFNAIQTAKSIVIDLETTGLSRHDCIVAVGVLCARDAHILITESHRNVSSFGLRITTEQLRSTLSPLTYRNDLQVTMHNATFDLGMLERAGIKVNCKVYDTFKVLKLHDSDRGWEQGAASSAGASGQSARLLRSTGEYLNYKLKDVARSQLNLVAKDFPGKVENRHLNELVPYLKSDLAVTSLLREHLDRNIDPKIFEYNEALVSPITKTLVRMSNLGVQADLGFIRHESNRLLELMSSISDLHCQQYGQRLDVGDHDLRKWIYHYGLKCPRVYSGKQKQLSLRATDLLDLRKRASCDKIRSSLELILDYKQIQSLMRRIKGLEKHVCRHNGRIFSSFNDVQSSGRVSSSKPNLQQLASELKFGGRKQLISPMFRDYSLRSRNAIVASDGYSLVAFDIAQADIRVLSHAVHSFGQDGARYVRKLQAERLNTLPPSVEEYLRRLERSSSRKISGRLNVRSAGFKTQCHIRNSHRSIVRIAGSQS